MNFHNVGRFKVSGFFFRKLRPLEGVNLFRDMVVLDVRVNHYTDEREYTAIHPQFEPNKLGDMVPEYVAYFSEGSSEPTWQKGYA